MIGPAAQGFPVTLATERTFAAPATSAQVKLRRFAVGLLLLGVTFGQRFCFPLGDYQIPLVVPLGYIALYLILFAGLGRIATMRLLLYALAIVCMIATLFVGKNIFSPYSFFYLVVLYLPFVFTSEIPRQEYLGYLKFFQYCLVPLAAIALLQLAEQFTTHTTFTLVGQMPSDFLLVGYNTRPVLYWGSDFYKSNAEFFLEPSFLSQYMALGIIIELLYFGSWWRIALYGAAIYSSFSGTGIVLLVIFAAASAVRARRYGLFAVLPVLLVVYLLVQDNPYVTAITGRIGEFSDPNSSAYERFIGPAYALQDLVWSHFSSFLVGHGPGVVERLGLSLYYHTTFPVPPKLLIEYGLVGTLPFLAFIIYCFFVRARSLVMASAFFLMYIVLSASLLQPHTVYLFYALGILMPRLSAEVDA